MNKKVSAREKKNLKIGFIGQGFIGKNYANDFEERGFNIVRYARDEAYASNKEKIKECDVVFIAVPTPSTPKGFDDSIVRSVIKLVGKGKVAVIKSTIVPGSTESIQKENPDIFVMHSPEFLTEKTAAHDAKHPDRNIVGIPSNVKNFKEKANFVLSVLPKAPYETVCTSREAEMIKYGGNCWFYFKVIYINLLYDIAQKLGCDYSVISQSMSADPRIGSTHLNPVHQGGRGAGGHCFIKDFSAFKGFYKDLVNEDLGLAVLNSLENKNIDLLLSSNKDLDLLKGVYGEDVVKRKSKGKK
jgi:nucleotide sugar dehydrogenase